MSATEDRLRKIIADNFELDREPDFGAQFSEVGVSSVEAVAFYKQVNDEFGLGLAPDDCLQFKTLRDLVSHIDARG